jgi:hypothetical protein
MAKIAKKWKASVKAKIRQLAPKAEQLQRKTNLKKKIINQKKFF